MQALLKDSLIINCAKPVFRYCIFAIIIGLVTGCSTTPKKATVPLMQHEPEDKILQAETMNKAIVVQTSLDDKRPAWIHKPTFVQGNSIYFTGGFLNGGDYSVTLRCANAEALKAVVQDVGQFIRTELSMFTQGTNDIESGVNRYIEDGIATFSKNLHIQGIRQAESFYEEMYDPISTNNFYNAWVKLEINKVDFLKAKAGVLKQLKEGFHMSGNIEVKEKAEALLKDLKGQISETI